MSSVNKIRRGLAKRSNPKPIKPIDFDSREDYLKAGGDAGLAQKLGVKFWTEVAARRANPKDLKPENFKSVADFVIAGGPMDVAVEHFKESSDD